MRDCELPRYFISRNLGLKHPGYLALLEFLSGYLKHVKSLSLLQCIHMHMLLKKNTELAKFRLDEINSTFTVNDPELQEFVDHILATSIEAMLKHMIETSALAMLLPQFLRLFTPLRANPRRPGCVPRPIFK
ncbi:hypothetical protein HSX11_03635 [Oxalobacteraceae bacterium]|nr:hypothetical protein [Oxalobacteraceae bacterium]